MTELGRGLYETLITEALEAQLNHLQRRVLAIRGPLRAAETAERIALHVARIIERALDSVGESKRPRVGTELARRLVDIVIGRVEKTDALRQVREGPSAEDAEDDRKPARKRDHDFSL